MRRRRRDLQLASLKLRFLAWLINTVIVLVAGVVAIGIWIFAAGRLGHRRGPSREPPRTDGADGTPLVARLQSTPAQLVLDLVGIAVRLVATGHRSPGFRVLRLRRIDARSGGQVTRRQELISGGTRNAWRLISNRLFPTVKARDSLDRDKLHSEIDAARREHGDDDEARRDAIMQIYRANRVNPRASCLRALPAALLAGAIELPVWSSLKQSLPDRVAGIIIAVDPTSRPRRRRR
jgi:hypothetical protein